MQSLLSLFLLILIFSCIDSQEKRIPNSFLPENTPDSIVLNSDQVVADSALRFREENTFPIRNTFDYKSGKIHYNEQIESCYE